MHNKEYALKLVQDKQNGLNGYSYSQIASLTGYKKLQIVRFSKQLKEKDIDSILVHGLTGKPSNNSPSDNEDVVWNPDMAKIVKENNLKVRSYSFYESLYEKFHWVKPIKHKCFNKEYDSHPIREPSPQRDILIMIDGTLYN